MDYSRWFVYVFSFLLIIISLPKGGAQSGNTARRSARALDALLQDYAYRAFVRPRTGVVFEAQVPANFSGIKLAGMRLRSGSLRARGVQNYKEFEIRTGVRVQPYVQRLVFVYQNLGNWSSLYYGLQGYNFLTPVLGLLAYDAANLSSTNLSELDVYASGQPILIKFTEARSAPQGVASKCVWIDLDGLAQFTNLSGGNVCSTTNQGHFAIVVESNASASPPPSKTPPEPGQKGSTPGKNNSKRWKIAVSVVAGVLGLLLLGFFVAWVLRKKRINKIEQMEHQAETGEALRMATVGNTRAPVAMGTRTPPVLENEYAP